jgi:hypothetical protein
MVQEMTEFWLGLFPDEDPGNMGFDEEMFEEVGYRMDKLLKFIEKKGMKPPVEDVCPVLFQTKHVWEQEND